MRKILFLCYLLLTFIFMVLTVFELVNYINFESNLIGLLYLILNFFIIFIMVNMIFSFAKSNYKVRISKNLIIIIVGILSSYMLGYILPIILDYTDKSFMFVKEIYVYSKILKPIIYVFLGIICVLEIMYKREINKYKKIT